MFKVGDHVQWTSQSGGYRKTKQGVVVALAPENTSLKSSPLGYARKHFPEHLIMFDGITWQPCGVLVEVRDGKTNRAKPKLYMPRVRQLSIVE